MFLDSEKYIFSKNVKEVRHASLPACNTDMFYQNTQSLSDSVSVSEWLPFFVHNCHFSHVSTHHCHNDVFIDLSDRSNKLPPFLIVSSSSRFCSIILVSYCSLQSFIVSSLRPAWGLPFSPIILHQTLD